MNFRHLKALLALRFQLSRNQIRKTGKINTIVTTIFMVLALAAAAMMFFVALVAGIILIPKASDDQLFLFWNLVTVLFVGVWMIGLLIELQQMELLSLDKLMHLPVSLRGAFLLNYTSSFINTTIAIFVPTFVGLSLAMVITRGVVMLMVPCLIVAFLFAVTTVTYQFRGWLGRLMENKRNRGTILAVMTIGIVMLSQLPNLVAMRSNDTRDRERTAAIEIRKTQMMNLQTSLEERMEAGEIDVEELEELRISGQERIQADHFARRHSRRSENMRMLVTVLQASDLLIPPGWLPYGIYTLDKGKLIPATLAILGFIGIGCLSLSISYRSTMRAYSGIHRKRRPAQKQTKVEASSNGPGLAAARIPFLKEQQAAVAISSFKSLLRAPETKMALLMPLIMCVVFGSLMMKDDFNIPTDVRPFLPLGGCLIILLAMSQQLFNQFGSDRDGFRCFVLSPVERRDILIGKNVGIFPFAFLLNMCVILALQIFQPMKATHLVASVIQVVNAHLIFCLLGNFVSIYFPYGVNRSTMKPAQMSFVTVVVMMLTVGLSPTFLIPTYLLLGFEYSILKFWEIDIQPFYLITSLAQLGLFLWVYRQVVAMQGELMQGRETRVLELVANVAE